MLPTDNQPTDSQLLARHAAGDPAAFDQLAARHVNWIYSIALRRTRNAAMASDVTQGVLISLSQKAAKLARHPSLPSWLFRATGFAASTLLRAERRRKRQEERAMHQNTDRNIATSSEWSELEPRLDDAVAHLSEKDRRAILLRFYRQLSHPEIAATLGITEEAARKRVDRALERLRKRMGAAAGLGAMLAASVVVLAPRATASAAIAGTISPRAVASAKIIHTMELMMKIKAVAVMIVALLVITTAGLTAWKIAGSKKPSTAATPLLAISTSPTTQLAPADAQGFHALPRTEEPGRVLLSDLITVVKKQEQAVQTISSKGSLSTTRLDRGRGIFVPDGGCEVDAVFEGIPGGKNRMEFPYILTRWIAGRSPFISQAVIQVYNGQFGAVLIREEGDEKDNMRKTGVLQITGTRPPNYSSGIVAAGWNYSILGCREVTGPDSRPQRLSEFLAELRDLEEKPENKVVVAPSTLNGRNYLTVTRMYKKPWFGGVGSETQPARLVWVKEVYFFDKERNFTITRFENHSALDSKSNPTWTLTRSWQVNSFHQLLPSIAYPKDVTEEIMTAVDGKIVVGMRRVTTITEVKLNDPSVNDKTFTLELPERVQYEDPETRERTAFSGTPEDRATFIADEVKRIKGKLREESSTAPAPANK